MKNAAKLVLVFPLLLLFTQLNAQRNFWKEIPESAVKATDLKRTIVPDHYKVLSLDTLQMLGVLRSAPLEFSLQSRQAPLILALPMPDGSVNHFNIVEYSMQEPGLQAQFPDIRTYSGQGIEDRTATVKLDWTGFGFHAMILSPVTGSVWIDPYARGNKTDYISYYKKDLQPREFKEIGVLPFEGARPSSDNSVPAGGPCLGGTLRTYRLAVANTGEYAVAVGGTTAPLLHSAIVTSVNRVNGVYETEVTIRLTLVATNNLVEFLTPGGDPFTGNAVATTLIGESQAQITTRIGVGNFDIGHTFSTGAGGLAGLGVVCNATQKARGVTGLPNPVGDAYDIDFVSHEIGHQFGGNHTFNAATGNCSGNGSASANAEPGSGTTIMAYAGICTTNDLQVHSDPQFHAISFNEIGTFSRSGGGSGCGTATATGNTPPVVNAGSNYVIPVSTPFTLTGSATDINGDLLTYSWEQIDVGGTFSNWNAPTGIAAPLFRSFQPTLSPSRTFPRMSDIANGTTTIGEILPAIVRDVDFRLTARDNRAGGGGICYAQMKVTTSGATPFNVTSQPAATNWVANGSNTATITWTTGFAAAPFNSPNVSILLSTDGGLTFPFTLLNSTANDGTENIVIPAQATTRGRVMVKSIGNVFFDINTGNITISSVCAAEGAIVAPAATVVALAGNAALNLGLAPQYATPLTISGTLQSTDPASTLAAFNTATAGCINFANPTKYDAFTFTPSVTGTYSFTLGTGAGTGVVTDLYNGAFDPANPCTNFLKSNISYTAPNPSLLPNISNALTAGNTYTLVVGTFDGTTPTLPQAYTVSYASTPAGGTIYSGSSNYVNPGATFNYTYVIVNTTTGNIVGISATANLTNSATYPAGTYAVYGLSYSNTIGTLNTYVGGNLNALTANVFANPGSFCANFSKNLVTVIITAPVPTGLLELTAHKAGSKAALNWKTSSELNSSHFNVLRSADGTNFVSTLGRVNAAGNSTTVKDYGFTDNSPLTKWNYYRIEEVDINGAKILSNIAAVSFDKNGNLVQLYPNPASSQLNVEYNSSVSGNLTLHFYDSKGSMVMRRTINVDAGRSVNSIDIAHLASGIYMLRYIGTDGVASDIKFIKK